MSSSRSKSDLVELKRQALDYYSMNSDIPKKVEEALNALFYESPYDAFGYLSEFFQNFSKPPFISRITAGPSLIYDSKCQPTIRIDLYGQEKNQEIKFASLECPCFTFDMINDSAKIQFIQEDDNMRHSKLDETRQLIISEINEIVKHHSPFDQDEIDEKLGLLFKNKQSMLLESRESQSLSSRKTSTVQDLVVRTPSSPKQKNAAKNPRKQSRAANVAPQEDDFNLIIHSHYYPSFVQASVSKLVCLSSSYLAKKQLFEHICDLYSRGCEKFSMPIPMVTVLQNGKGFNGKQNLIKEIILVPKSHLSIQKAAELIGKVNRQLRDTLYQSKQQPGGVNKCTTDIGCFTCQLDTSQQALELIDNAITAACGSNEDLNIALNLAAGEFFDQEKNKYEIANGALKSSDELIELYSDLIAKNPRIVMLIEPFANSDHLAWYKLYLKVSGYCFLGNNIKMNNNFYRHRAETEQKDDSNKLVEILNPRSLEMPVNFYKFENMVSLTSMIRKLSENSGKNLYSGLCCSTNETNDSFISDLSVASQVKFVRIGGMNRLERVAKINRLIEIEQYLKDNNRLVDPNDPSREFKFNELALDIPGDYLATIKNQDENKKPAKTNKNAD